MPNDLPTAPKDFAKLDMCSHVDGTLSYVRDGAGALYAFRPTGTGYGFCPVKPNAAELSAFVRFRKNQIKLDRMTGDR